MIANQPETLDGDALEVKLHRNRSGELVFCRRNELKRRAAEDHEEGLEKHYNDDRLGISVWMSDCDINRRGKKSN
ncbi:hypothetical protein SK128_011451 [Halocaridina rubra]|uniref:Uncharacterized protein n=1 Tax=Halocaridina rubra TaxID=373956 RepID=A0AAN8WLH6_HALRR